MTDSGNDDNVLEQSLALPAESAKDFGRFVAHRKENPNCGSSPGIFGASAMEGQ